MSTEPAARISVRDLCNRAGDVLTQVQQGETIIITSDDAPVAELRPLRRRSRSATELVARRTRPPRIDTGALRADVDALMDQRP